MQQPLGGKTFVITGATSGIGLAAAELLILSGAAVIGVGRSVERCHRADQRLRALVDHPIQASFLVADLGLQSEVRGLSCQIGGALDDWEHPHLDALINNAATVPYWQTLTAEGFDMQWAVNHLAPFLLTAELLPRLRAAPAARVITVSSDSHRHARLNWQDMQLLRRYNPLTAYCQTKLANVLFTAELNRRLGEDSTVRAFAADPGLVNTDIGLKSNSYLARAVWNLRRRAGVHPKLSAAHIVFLASQPAIQTSTDIYWKKSKPTKPSTNACNAQSAKQLWELSSQMCGISA